MKTIINKESNTNLNLLHFLIFKILWNIKNKNKPIIALNITKDWLADAEFELIKLNKRPKIKNIAKTIIKQINCINKSNKNSFIFFLSFIIITVTEPMKIIGIKM